MAEYRLKTPISEEDIRKLHVGDTIYISGTMVTARDSAHKRALEFFRRGEPLPVNLEGGVVYHCGPLAMKEDDKWRVVAAGPTTSARMEMFEADFIKAYGVRVVVGKGGMGQKTVDAMKEYGAVYAAFTGGAAVLAAQAIKRVVGVEWLDLGVPEALWIFEVEDFGPLTVAIDAHGNNLLEDVRKKALERKARIYEMLGV